ncbi:serine/threonine-protein kinase [Streptomyces cyaneofuscatus]|uniref:non-specific serine/threonine protein kinase n=1 Tax=Streptomyces cyaneofuscatus TaxID=66883 RepID=A0ABZ1F223_9ACTN|nr:serine/threonine-protein kinase [Streptomyces cyaneofuscatus]WSB10381.1 serine/threonine protein kinase [Streptomyces cyaneofuscatus]WSD46086.1 serine/threonine protein kinase [Streptomyces cyaneofuscatus]WTA89461.1 serine/threonine protein kinase [Streptomyces cyaneofuscatus]
MSAEAPSGRVIDGRFTLVERLGSGGMGMVWRAHDEALHRDVALKEVRPPDPALAEYDPEGARTLRARVLREARALARLDHPNVVTVHHIVDPGEDGYPWIVMELVAGSSLHDRLAEGPMDPAEAAELGRGILSALNAAHASGIQHRDVKPANVLLRTDGRPVLTDFGIAAIRESTSLTMTGALIGSPDYIAPERIRGTEGDPSSDLWSLGMMLYVAVEGHHPLRKATTLATLAAVLDEEVPPPVRAGALTPVLTALLTRDIPARPDAGTLDRMLAEAARPQPAPDPRSAYGSPQPQPPHPSAGFGHPTPFPTPADAPHKPHANNPYANNPYAGPSTPPTPPPATVPTVTGDEERRHRLLRRTRIISTAATVVSAAVLAGVFWMIDPSFFRGGGDGGDDSAKGNNRPDTTASAPANDRSAAPPTAAGQPVADDEESGSDDGDDGAEAPADLLTPQGARQAIAALKPLMGGTKVTDFTLYGEHASAQAPLKSNSRLYDRFSYRDGQAKNDDMGGTLMSGDKAVDLNSVDWDALPALLRTARTSLNIPDPESSYVIVDPSSPFHDDRPVLRVYVSDSYGGAYLTAELDGRVIEKNPREKG